MFVAMSLGAFPRTEWKDPPIVILDYCKPTNPNMLLFAAWQGSLAYARFAADPSASIDLVDYALAVFDKVREL